MVEPIARDGGARSAGACDAAIRDATAGNPATRGAAGRTASVRGAATPNGSAAGAAAVRDAAGNGSAAGTAAVRGSAAGNRSATAATPAPTLTRADLVAWRNAVFVIFGLSGLALATWLSRTPSIRDLLHASTAEMGLIVFGLSVGSIVGLSLSSHLLAFAGPKRVIAGCLVVVSVGMVIAGFGAGVTHHAAVVVVGLALIGFGNGMCDVAMNVEGAAVERALRRTVMPLFHAAFSGGTVIGAGVGALAELFGVPVLVHFGALAIVIAVGGVIAVRYLKPHPDAPEAAAGETLTTRERMSVWLDRGTLLIGLIALGMAFAEGSANDWLPLAMVDGHDVSNAAGSFVLGLFVTAMTVGRILGVRLLDRYGRVPVLRLSGLLAAVGLAVVIFVPSALVASIGVVAWGLGASLGFPVAMSAASDDPRLAAARVSAVATIGYLAFLVGPPMIGFLGQHFGLLHGLLPVFALVTVAALASGAARKRE